MDSTVKATRNKDQIRLELLGNWKQKFIASVPVLVTPKLSLLLSLFCILDLLKGGLRDYASLPGYVDVEASTCTASRERSLAVSSSREESHIVVTM